MALIMLVAGESINDIRIKFNRKIVHQGGAARLCFIGNQRAGEKTVLVALSLQST